MESHITNLYKLCRVCGGKVITKYGYVNVKTCNDYADLLTVGILPLRDKEVSENLYPFKYCRFLCSW